jgi:hypothetical protein
VAAVVEAAAETAAATAGSSPIGAGSVPPFSFLTGAGSASALVHFNQ